MINAEFYQKKIIIDKLHENKLISDDEWYKAIKLLVDQLEINIE